MYRPGDQFRSSSPEKMFPRQQNSPSLKSIQTNKPGFLVDSSLKMPEMGPRRFNKVD